MKKTIFLAMFLLGSLTCKSQYSDKSVYTLVPEDQRAVFFTSGNFDIKPDGRTDCTAELQKAIDEVEASGVFGLVFIPEGRYLITNTIYIWKGIRLIGYGRSRPEFILGENTPGYAEGEARYMFHFTSSKPREGESIRDANPGTFYSALNNIDLTIKKGNPAAVAVRSHFAQHCFLANINFKIGEGKAGVHQVGNEIVNCSFSGGEFGIMTTKPSPSWPFLLIDSYFEGQRTAAIETEEGGFTIIRNHFRNLPTAVSVRPDREEKLFMENCRLENIAGPAIIISDEFNSCPQYNLKNLTCINTPVLAFFRKSKKEIRDEARIYEVVDFIHGNQISDLGKIPGVSTIYNIEKLNKIPPFPESDLPPLPSQETWVNVVDLGAVGDGETDNTQIIQNAIGQHNTLYFPTGRYRVTNTIVLKKNTVLIGFSPIRSQILLKDRTPVFEGPGGPKALIETPPDGENIVTGIGLDAGGINPRAVAAKWMAGKHSLMNDVKFLGGHGTYDTLGNYLEIYNNNRTADSDRNRRWDSQYWSLWITDGGGGTFKDIWTASPFAQAGLFISNTSTEGRIYGMSLEHHVRFEAQFKNVSNWKIYDFQMEEERGEGWNCLPLEIDNCHDIRFANVYLYRSMMVSPFRNGIVIKDSKNIEFCGLHTYSPTRYTYDNMLFDANFGTEIRSREIANLKISGDPPEEIKRTFESTVVAEGETIRKLATGFEFIDALTIDATGNAYFIDGRWHRIYRWNFEKELTDFICDLPLNPVSMGFDRSGKLLVSTTRNQVLTFYPESPVTDFSVIEASDSEDRPEATALVVKHLWRNAHDFIRESTRKCEKQFVSGDASVYIPFHNDLRRTYNLGPVRPGEKFYMADEFGQKTYSFDVAADGSLFNPKLFAEEGEFDADADYNGNVYIPAGQIFVYDKEGKQIDLIEVPERPSGVAFGGPDGKTLFISAHSSLYSIKIK